MAKEIVTSDAPMAEVLKLAVLQQNPSDLRPILEKSGRFTSDQIDKLIDALNVTLHAINLGCTPALIQERFETAQRFYKTNIAGREDEPIGKVPDEKDFIFAPPNPDRITIPVPNVPWTDKTPYTEDRFPYLSPQKDEDVIDNSDQPLPGAIQFTTNRYSGDIVCIPRIGCKFDSVDLVLQQPTEDGKGDYRYGLKITEVGEGVTHTTFAYLYYIFEGENHGWQLEVVNESGKTDVYSFGQSTHQNVVGERSNEDDFER